MILSITNNITHAGITFIILIGLVLILIVSIIFWWQGYVERKTTEKIQQEIIKKHEE